MTKRVVFRRDRLYKSIIINGSVQQQRSSSKHTARAALLARRTDEAVITINIIWFWTPMVL